MPLPTFTFKKANPQPATETSNVEIIAAEQAPKVEEPAEPIVEQPAPEILQEEKAVAKTTCQTSAHLNTYPLYKEAADFIEEIPGVKAVKSTTNSFIDPAVQFVANQPFIQPVIQTVDGLGVQALSTVDSFTPSIKTTTYSGITTSIQEPFKQAGQAINSAKVSANDTIEQHVIAPTVKLVHDTRALYNEHLYDTKGKPLLRSSLDPVFRPINRSIEDFTQKNLPEAEPVSNEFSSEIERNVHLSLDLVQRSIPVINEKVVQVVMAPCEYTKHAVDVFNDNLMKQEQTNIVTGSVIATYDSSKDLAVEAWNETATCFNKTFGFGDHALVVTVSETAAELNEEIPAAETVEPVVESVNA